MCDQIHYKHQHMHAAARASVTKTACCWPACSSSGSRNAHAQWKQLARGVHCNRYLARLDCAITYLAALQLLLVHLKPSACVVLLTCTSGVPGLAALLTLHWRSFLNYVCICTLHILHPHFDIHSAFKPNTLPIIAREVVYFRTA
jgi:hypothetical protein